MSFRIAAAFGAVWLAVSSLAGPAWAHEGHDHDAPPPPVSKSIAPRGEAVSDAFELTAIPRDGKITLYLDRFRTNDPVRGAVVEVETPEGPKLATETDEAAYVLPAPWMTKPGSHDLLVTVTAGDVVDVLTVTVAVPEAKPSAPAASPQTSMALTKASAAITDLKARLVARDPVLVVTAAGAFLLGMLLTVAMHGRRSLPALALVAVVVTLVGPADPASPVVDLGYRGARLALQYDGAGHRTAQQQARDARRDAYCLEREWTTLRCTWEDQRAGFGRIVGLVRRRLARTR